MVTTKPAAPGAVDTPEAEPQPAAAPAPHWTLHETQQPRVTRALAWAASTPAKESDLARVLARCANHPKG
ncbi:MAG: hypothetical protein ABW061_02430 [Polyangiaceae bacterium]